MKLTAKFIEIANTLKDHHFKEYAKETEILIIESLNINKIKLYSKEIELSKKQISTIDRFISRRIQKEPIQYITGWVDFYGLKIKVGSGVLIPRLETELLVETTINQIKNISLQNKNLTIADICTGTGCIAIAIATNFPQSVVYATDKSEISISYAKKNANYHKIKNIIFKKGNLFENISNLKFDYIISNPPYIKSNDINNLQQEIRNYEPIDALDGGEDGLYFFREILKNSQYFIKDNGILTLEIGAGQSKDIKEIALTYGFNSVDFIKDYSDIERIFIGKKQKD